MGIDLELIHLVKPGQTFDPNKFYKVGLDTAHALFIFLSDAIKTLFLRVKNRWSGIFSCI